MIKENARGLTIFVLFQTRRTNSFFFFLRNTRGAITKAMRLRGIVRNASREDHFQGLVLRQDR